MSLIFKFFFLSSVLLQKDLDSNEFFPFQLSFSFT